MDSANTSDAAPATDPSVRPTATDPSVRPTATDPSGISVTTDGPSAAPLCEPTRRYRVAQRLVRGLLAVLADMNVEGRDRFPEAGPYIVAINHISLMDAVVAFAVVPHQFAGVVAAGWVDKRFFGPLMRYMTEIYPVDSERTDPRELARAVRWLKGGGVLLLAPEGRISETGALVRGSPGLAYIAGRTGTPVVALAAWGQEKAEQRLKRLRRPRIEVRVGEPYAVPQPERKGRDAQLAGETESIMMRIAALLPDQYRGEYL